MKSPMYPKPIRYPKVSPMIAHCLPKRLLACLPAAALAALLLGAIADPAAARRDREVKRDDAELSRPAGAPLMAVVALGEQRVTIYDADGRILRAPVSTGQRGYETPAGIYSIIQKNREHYSNLYDDAEMPFMQRITWSGIALHAGQLPGYPASHGCIRLPYAFAERLFDATKMGMRVVVMPRDAAPVEIAHAGLFQPLPIAADVAAAPQPASGEQPQKMRLGAVTPDANVPPPTVPPRRLQTLRSIAEAKAAEAEAAAKKADAARLAASRATREPARLVKAQRLAEAANQRADAQLKNAEAALEAANSPAEKERAEEAKAKAAAKVAEAQAQLDAAKAEAQPLADAAERAREEAKRAEADRVAAVAAAKEAAARMSPVSVFISRQTQKLYVRQAFQPLFENPVTIRDVEQPIGTHIYTALDYTEGGAGVRWSALTMTRGQDANDPDKGRRYRSARSQAEPTVTNVAGARAALDRISIPQEAIDRISEVVSPGSSLIISDEPISRETGKGTDFIVVMSGEPQGGIKIRRRPQPWGAEYERGYGRSPYGRSPYWGGGGSPYFRW
jgi:hypothetical protein